MDQWSEPAPDLIRGRADEPHDQEPAPAEAGDATVRRSHYDNHGQLRAHLTLFVDAYNYARRLKTLRGLTPYEFVCKTWTEQPHRFRADPIHLTSGPNN